MLTKPVIKLNVQNETSRLRSVVLGTAESNGPIPKIEECYDPKSIEHIKAGTYPEEDAMVEEINAVLKVFKKYDVKVYRPQVIENCNQIFSRDIAFVIDDIMIEANILPHREEEVHAIDYIWNQIAEDKRIILPEDCHVEGGDVMHGTIIFLWVLTPVRIIQI
ncbi:NG,NG-dimethylarginine dimethylaminohydrolase 1 [Jejuia pallidilutea]|uniref:NG,NG-dimethylarginine dimethylaminohydrolase 1 n=1 Tax=Jejuia pallidilutea TaxID=504487 RepID=A0A090W3U9_9FLAO|nr:NG,NG-dimethylarginine dimethylaminohydrolase 1 [Jejuia pallidilutea]